MFLCARRKKSADMYKEDCKIHRNACARTHTHPNLHKHTHAHTHACNTIFEKARKSCVGPTKTKMFSHNYLTYCLLIFLRFWFYINEECSEAVLILCFLTYSRHRVGEGEGGGEGGERRQQQWVARFFISNSGPCYIQLSHYRTSMLSSTKRKKMMNMLQSAIHSPKARENAWPTTYSKRPRCTRSLMCILCFDASLQCAWLVCMCMRVYRSLLHIQSEYFLKKTERLALSLSI